MIGSYNVLIGDKAGAEITDTSPITDHLVLIGDDVVGVDETRNPPGCLYLGDPVRIVIGPKLFGKDCNLAEILRTQLQGDVPKLYPELDRFDQIDAMLKALGERVKLLEAQVPGADEVAHLSSILDRSRARAAKMSMINDPS